MFKQIQNLNKIQKLLVLLIIANILIGDQILFKTISYGGDDHVIFTNPFDSNELMAQVFWGLNLVFAIGIFIFKDEK